ncbi:Hypothetical protein I595_2661 [Croceitalea dokdonensis DOKDO 023]|uniref:Uncharacterized protein n=1 Tax=Croceitalea dokdonensis DOKDO 023 TaxID=1300341 RepID=A0A0P7AU89_9FLAO|nr:Hypothetical protein I595_2661 [Croceitalea dokdonensis DOKDO 023]
MYCFILNLIAQSKESLFCPTNHNPAYTRKVIHKKHKRTPETMSGT